MVTINHHWQSKHHALAFLYPAFMEDGNVISPLNGYQPTDEDWSAIEYLIKEWGFSYSAERKPGVW